MICRFETKPMAVAGPGAAVAPEAGGQGPPPSAVAGAANTVLTPVLQKLIGREVKVIAGCHCYSGRVLQSDPLTLIGPCGEVMIIAQSPSSVQY